MQLNPVFSIHALTYILLSLQFIWVETACILTDPFTDWSAAYEVELHCADTDGAAQMIAASIDTTAIGLCEPKNRFTLHLLNVRQASGIVTQAIEVVRQFRVFANPVIGGATSSRHH